MWTTRVFSGDSRSPIGAKTVATSAQRLGLFLLSGHQDDEVVGVADEPVVRQALTAAFLSLLLDSHRRLPLLGEVIIQHGQAMLASSERIPPCGVPVMLPSRDPVAVRTPALRKDSPTPERACL